MTTIPLESLGDSISSAVLVSWEKSEGEQVNEDDVIAVVETDKVTMDIRAKQSGVFSGGFCAEGDEVSTPQPHSLTYFTTSF
jgi:2-oxoglutarate dehydrogenase E2 component (dihydrolipoamide succinyltransferase)